MRLTIFFLFISVFAQAQLPTIPAKQITGLPGATIYIKASGGATSGNGATTASAVTYTYAKTIYTGGERLFFEADGTYTGTPLTVKSNTQIGAYGEGAKPIISGTVASTSLTWTQAGAIWSAPITTRVTRVLLAGVPQKTAQGSYITVTSSGGDIINSGATGLSNVTQMEMIAKERDYRFTYYTIDSYNSGTGAFDVDRATTIATNYQFKLINHSSLIAADGDWAWHGNTVYYRSPGNVNPNTLDVELSIYEEGFIIEEGASNVSIDGIDFYAQSIDGIYGRDINGISITNCSFRKQHSFGVMLAGNPKSVTIDNNIFEGIGFSGFSGYLVQGFKVTRNKVTNIGVIKGTNTDPPFVRGLTARYDNVWSASAGLFVSTHSSDGTFEDNVLDSLNYLGIRADGHNITINNNRVTNGMMRTTDGGGIYTMGNMGDGTTSAYDITISNNYTANNDGSLEAVPGGTFNMANGIYLDNFTERVKVFGNTSEDNGTYGAYTGDDTRYNEFEGNRFYNNAKAQFAIYNSTLGGTGGYVSTGITLKNNKLTSLNTAQYGVWIQSASNGDDPFDGGETANNTFYNPYNSLAARVTYNSTNYTVAGIETYLGEDFGEADSYTASYVNEATAKANVPLRLNIANSDITTPSSGGGGGGSVNQWDYQTHGLSYDSTISIGTTSPFPGITPASDYVKSLDIAGPWFMTGGDEDMSGGRTNNTGKAARLVIPHYENAEEPAAMLIAGSNSGNNFLFFGGGTSRANAATIISFYAAANTETTTGDAQMVITHGNIRLPGLAGNGSGVVAVDNDGDLSWLATPSGGGGSSNWTVTGSDLYRASKVTIGAASAPSHVLHVIASDSNPIAVVEKTSTHTADNTYGFQAKTALGVLTFGVDSYFDASGAGMVSTTTAGGIVFSGNNSNVHMRLSSSGAFRLNTYGSGTLVTDGSGNVTASSDETLKNIKGEFNTGLAAILKINPIQYSWNKKSGFDMTDTYAGFSAQNVKLAIPYSTGLNSDGTLTLQDRAIMATMVNAIQELNAKILRLEKNQK
jgi:hypothetical protein